MTYLSHYGVKGMKWGVRRERKRQAKVIPLAKDDIIENSLAVKGVERR